MSGASGEARGDVARVGEALRLLDHEGEVAEHRQAVAERLRPIVIGRTVDDHDLEVLDRQRLGGEARQRVAEHFVAVAGADAEHDLGAGRGGSSAIVMPPPG